MASRQPMPSRGSPRLPGPSQQAYEVPEFMVRRLDGQVNPVLLATPDSGVTYIGKGQWAAEEQQEDPIDLDEIYRPCIEAQNSLVSKANELCAKRKIPPLDLSTSHTWYEVHDSAAKASDALDLLSEKDQHVAPGVGGRLKKAFRALCDNAGAGKTVTNFVPSDGYLSVLCGGLKVVFTALEQTGQYREDVCGVLEELPAILTDSGALLEQRHRDEQLHRRVVALYTNIFKLMEIVIDWFLKSRRVTGAKLFSNPSGLSSRLKNSLQAVKNSAQRFNARVITLSDQDQLAMRQQNYTIMFAQEEHSQYVRGEFGRLRNDRIIILDKLTQLLESQAQAAEQLRVCGRSASATHARGNIIPRLVTPDIEVGELLERFLYDPELVLGDCESILKLRHVPGYAIDEDLVSTVKNHPRFLSWLTLNESSLLFLDTRPHSPGRSLEMPLVAADTFRSLVDFAAELATSVPEDEDEEGSGTLTEVICLAYFCSQHSNFTKDVGGAPTELVMSLLLQLVDRYRGFDPADLGDAFEQLDPEDIDSICDTFRALVSRLPANVILVLIVDDLRDFTEPYERRCEMMQVVSRVVEMHQNEEYEATLKCIFSTSIRAKYLDELFDEADILRIWGPLSRWNGL